VVGHSGSVDQDVDATEGFVNRGDYGPAIFDPSQVSGNEANVTACFGRNAGRYGHAFLLRSTAGDNGRGACMGELSRNGCAKPLGASRNNGDLSVNSVHVQILCPIAGDAEQANAFRPIHFLTGRSATLDSAPENSGARLARRQVPVSGIPSVYARG
jgi:hypothetical protein